MGMTHKMPLSRRKIRAGWRPPYSDPRLNPNSTQQTCRLSRFSSNVAGAVKGSFSHNLTLVSSHSRILATLRRAFGVSWCVSKYDRRLCSTIASCFSSSSGKTSFSSSVDASSSSSRGFAPPRPLSGMSMLFLGGSILTVSDIAYPSFQTFDQIIS